MRRISKLLFSAATAICAFVCLFCMSACGEQEAPPAAEEYTLTFVLPTGAGTLSPVRAQEGAAIEVPQAPQFAGHTFRGWYLNADGTGEEQTLPSVMPGEDRTYYAVYEQARFTLEFVAEGLTIRPVGGREGAAIVPPSDPQKSGYRFDGWYLEEDFSGERQAIPSVMPGENRTYYAKFTKVSVLSFVTGGAGAIADIVAPAGEAIVPPADPELDGKYFAGWFTQPDGRGEQVTIPTVMPDADRIVYYAFFRSYFRLSFDANGAAVSGEMPAIVAGRDGIVTVPQNAYTATGLYFLGWTTQPDGKLKFDLSGNLSENSGYAGGEQMTLTADTTLYAQWAVGYRDEAGSQDVVYIAQNVTGIGSAVLVRPEQPVKLGFFSDDGNGNAEFTFYFDAAEGGDYVGRLNANGSYRLRDKTFGYWMQYDHAAGETLPALFYSDGYGNAGIFTVSGDQIRISVYGLYAAAEDDEYRFTEVDPTTGKPSEGGTQFYFILQKAEGSAGGAISLSGYFLSKGAEAESYFLYANGSIGGNLLELNGYGGARLYTADAQGQPVLAAEGSYSAVKDGSGMAGEWSFTPRDGTGQAFRFVLSSVQDGAGYTYFVYLVYDALHAGELSERNGAGKIVADGYGGMRYTAASGAQYEGMFLYEAGAAPNTTFYAYGETGEIVAQIYFDIDWTARTFAVSNREFIVRADGVLTDYTGTSKTVEIPASVDGIAVTAIADDVFNGDALVSVVVPATVRQIGARAFQNADGTLRRVTFLGTVPPALDLSAANDPFRWPSASFVIVVPDAAVQAYTQAFSAAWTAGGRTGELYRIRGASEADRAPEFEVNEEGVLIAYNRPAGAEGAYDLVLAYGQTEYGGRDILITGIADEVFMGDADLRSIDLGAVTSVGEFAFGYCAGLRSVQADRLQSIGTGAFFGCEALGAADGSLELPAVTEIGMNAFRGCISLRRVTTGAALKTVGAAAFAEIKTDADRTTPFYFVLTGSLPPQMAHGMVGSESTNVFLGNSAYKIVIPDIAYAVACYGKTDWTSYCNSLYIPSGSEQGMYLSGSDVLQLDGRAVFLGTEIWLYAVSGNTISFYVYSGSLGGYTVFSGTIENNVIAFTYGGISYRFRKAEGTVRYTSTDGAYTLEVLDARELDPEYWAGCPWFDENGDPVYMTDEDGNVLIGADGKPVQATVPPALWQVRVRLNGKDTLMALNGYSAQKTISGFIENGIAYDFTLTLGEGTFTYSRKILPRTLTAADGSTFTVSGSPTLLFANLTLKDFWIVVNGVRQRVNESASYTATSAIAYPLGNAFAVQINIRGTAYLVYIGTDGDAFTYGVGLAGRTAALFAAEDGTSVFVTYDGESIVSAAVIRGSEFLEAQLVAQQGNVLTLTAGAQTLTVTLSDDGTCIIQ